MSEMITYQAVHTVHLGQIKTEISAGETFQFDGQSIVLRGETHVLPSIKVAIQQGWFRPVATETVASTPKTAAAPKTKVPVVQDQVSANNKLSQASSTPASPKEATVRNTSGVNTASQSGFTKNVVLSDDDNNTTSQKTFASGTPVTKAPVGESTQEGKVVGKTFKTATSRKLHIGSDADLSREASALEKETTPSDRPATKAETRESQTVAHTGRVERQATSSQMDTLEDDGSFMTQTSEGVTMKVTGSFNRSKMKVVTMDGGYLNENGEDARVVNTVGTPAPIQTEHALTQKAIQAAETGKVVDVTTPDLKPFNWDMTKHWKTRVREAAQYKGNPTVYNQILSMETPTVVRHLKEAK